MDQLKPHIYEIEKIADPRGNLSVLQYPASLPFEPRRAYWICDVPGGMMRHGHAFHTSHEVIIAVSGSFGVTTESTDGETKRFTLSQASQGLYIPPMTWRELDRFATNSVALIISSDLYDEADYIRDINIFRSQKGNGTEQ